MESSKKSDFQIVVKGLTIIGGERFEVFLGRSDVDISMLKVVKQQTCLKMTGSIHQDVASNTSIIATNARVLQ